MHELFCSQNTIIFVQDHKIWFDFPREYIFLQSTEFSPKIKTYCWSTQFTLRYTVYTIHVHGLFTKYKVPLNNEWKRLDLGNETFKGTCKITRIVVTVGRLTLISGFSHNQCYEFMHLACNYWHFVEKKRFT